MGCEFHLFSMVFCSGLLCVAHAMGFHGFESFLVCSALPCCLQVISFLLFQGFSVLCDLLCSALLCMDCEFQLVFRFSRFSVVVCFAHVMSFNGFQGCSGLVCPALR